jgi:hypothetical protein
MFLCSSLDALHEHPDAPLDRALALQLAVIDDQHGDASRAWRGWPGSLGLSATAAGVEQHAAVVQGMTSKS